MAHLIGFSCATQVFRLGVMICATQVLWLGVMKGGLGYACNDVMILGWQINHAMH